MNSRISLIDQLMQRIDAGIPLPRIAGGDGEGDPPPKTPVPTPDPAPDLAKLVDAAVAKHGDGTSALKAIISDNYSLRDDLKATKAKLPEKGSIVLSGDDAKAWGAYSQLGKPSDLKKALDEGETAKKEAGTFKRKEHHHEVAGVAGFKPTVLDKLASTDNLTLVVKDEKDKAGKPVKVAYVQGEGDAVTPLTEYADKNWKEFLPALKGTPDPLRLVPGGTPPNHDFRAAPKPQMNPETPRRVNSL